MTSSTITTTNFAARLDAQAEATWDYLAGGDYTAIFQWLESIQWVRIYNATIRVIAAFITFWFVLGYVVGRAARMTYDAARLYGPIALVWIQLQQEQIHSLITKLLPEQQIEGYALNIKPTSTHHPIDEN